MPQAAVVAVDHADHRSEFRTRDGAAVAALRRTIHLVYNVVNTPLDRRP